MRPNPNPPTERQLEVLRWIVEFTISNDLPPSIRHVTKGLGFKSHNSVNGHVRALRARGLLRCPAYPGQPGALRPTPEGYRALWPKVTIDAELETLLARVVQTSGHPDALDALARALGERGYPRGDDR